MKLTINHIEKAVVFLLLFLLPTQFGKHFFFDFSFINGVKIDYLAFVLYSTDILVLFLLSLYYRAFLDHILKYRAIFFTFGLLFAINIVQSQQPILAIYTIGKFYEVYFLFFLFRYRVTKIPFMVAPLLLGSLIQVGLTLLQFTQRHSMQGVFYYLGERITSVATPGIAKTVFFGEQILRPYGTFSHPNSLGGFYVFIYALCLFLLSKESHFKIKLLIYGLIGTSSMLLLISFSKVAIVAYLFITLLYVLRFQGNTKRKPCLICDLSKFIVPLIVSLIFIQTQSGPESLEQRLVLYQQSIMVLFKTYFLGTGFGQYLYFQSSYPTPYPFFFLQPVHNVFVLFLLQAGIVTTAFAGYCGFWFLQRYYKHLKYLILAVVITGLFDHYWLTLQQNLLVVGVVFGFSTRFIDRPKP